MTYLVLSMWEQKRGNHSSIESSPIIVLGSSVSEIFRNLTCACEIFKVTNAKFCKRLEYTLELFNFEGKPARLGGPGKFCSIAGEEVDGEGRKRRAERVNTTNIGRRVVILSSLNNLHSRFELSQVIYYMYNIYFCFCPRSLCFKKGKVSALQKEAKAASSEICSLSPCRPNCLLHLGMSPKIPILMY